MDEQWKVIQDFPAYEVSDIGRIRRASTGTVLVVSVNSATYLHIGLYVGGKQKYRLIHQLVLRTFVGSPPTSRHVAAHKDGNKQNCRLDNLRWATPEENWVDRKECNTRALKLCQSDVDGIRQDLSQGMAQAEVARRRELDPTTIYAIAHRRIWK